MVVELGIGIGGLVLGLVLGKIGGLWQAGRSPAEAEGNAYIRGLNYILSDAPDRAIDEFTKAVRINSETIETYQALGSLFRSKGDVSRAIRIHQGIICRPNIDASTMVQALYDLGLDYRKAGLLDRAIETFEQVVSKDPKMLKAHVQLEQLYEEVKDWQAALRAQEKIDRLTKTESKNVLAHLVTEMGKAQVAQGDTKTAQRTFKRALAIDPKCVDTYLHLGDLYAEEGHDEKAVQMWKKAMEVSPSLTFLSYDRLEHAFFRLGKVEALEAFLRELGAEEEADYFTRILLARHLRKKGELGEAHRVLGNILDQWPDAREARQELIEVLVLQGDKDRALEEYERLLHSLKVIERQFQCRMCGYMSSQLFWKCPQCHRWDTMGISDKGSADEHEAEESPRP